MSGRRRGKVLEAAIFEAVLFELGETGYVDLSIERIASRARTSKPVIYRRWPSRARLVLAALSANGDLLSFIVPDTGTVRGDVLLVLQRISNIVDKWSGEVVFGLIAELLHENDVSRFATLLERSTGMMMEIVNRGIARGEVAAEKVTPRVVALPMDLARHQLAILQKPLSDQDIEDILDRIFLPLIRAN